MTPLRKSFGLPAFGAVAADEEVVGADMVAIGDSVCDCARVVFKRRKKTRCVC